jgi:hypothetical protein
VSNDQAIIIRGVERELERATRPAPAPATKSRRRAPRKRSGGPIIEVRLKADNEEQAQQACAIVEKLLATLNCRMQRPRQGTNPKYEGNQRWMVYGDFDLPTATEKKRVRKKK